MACIRISILPLAKQGKKCTCDEKCIPLPEFDESMCNGDEEWEIDIESPGCGQIDGSVISRKAISDG